MLSKAITIGFIFLFYRQRYLFLIERTCSLETYFIANRLQHHPIGLKKYNITDIEL